ncbi:MAG: HAD-IA family hydrolase [Pseudomonadota bacterium]
MTRADTEKVGNGLSGVKVCFDLDGTLVDTAPDLVRVTNEVIAGEGLGPTDYDAARRVVGLGSRKLITDALARGGIEVPEAKLDAMQAEFLDRYAAGLSVKSRPFSGVTETLSLLKTYGARLSVCTTKPGWLARPLLDELELSQWFDRVVGGDEAVHPKPRPGHIFQAAASRDATTIVMIGDSRPDMEAARRAKVFSVLMTYGYSMEPQIRLRADARLRDFRKIAPTLIDRYAEARGPRR